MSITSLVVLLLPSLSPPGPVAVNTAVQRALNRLDALDDSLVARRAFGIVLVDDVDLDRGDVVLRGGVIVERRARREGDRAALRCLVVEGTEAGAGDRQRYHRFLGLPS